MEFLHLTWKGEVAGNTPSDFVTVLSQPISLYGSWEVALTDIRFKADKKFSVFVFSDACEQSHVHGRLAPVLRRVDKQTDVFVNPYFIKVSTKRLERIKIYVKGLNLQEVKLSDFACTLCLRKNGISIFFKWKAIIPAQPNKELYLNNFIVHFFRCT